MQNQLKSLKKQLYLSDCLKLNNSPLKWRGSLTIIVKVVPKKGTAIFAFLKGQNKKRTGTMKRFLSVSLAFAAALVFSVCSFAEEMSFSVLDEALKITSLKELEKLPDNKANFGDSIYYAVKVRTENEESLPSFLKRSEEADELKVSSHWEEGTEFIKGASLLPKMIKGEGSIYLIEVSTEEAPFETEERDIIGSITLKTKEGDITVNAAFTLNNPVGDITKTTDKNMVYSFGEGEKEQEIGLFGNIGSFTTDTRGQRDIVLMTDVSYSEGIENISPDTAYVYFNSNNATFNKIGTLSLSAKDGSYLYRVNSDGTLKLCNAPYDEEDEAFKIKTRVLGSYVISEGEMDTEKINSSVETDSKTLGASMVNEEKHFDVSFVPVNPQTGA